MFLGSILGSIVLSLGAPATGDPQTVVIAWRAVEDANTFLTVPGMLVVGVSGLALMLVQGRRPWQERWVGLKLLLMIAIVANATLLILPAEDQLRHLATALPASEARESFMNAALKQQIYGAANLALITLAAVLGVVKPRLQGARASRFRRTLVS